MKLFASFGFKILRCYIVNNAPVRHQHNHYQCRASPTAANTTITTTALPDFPHSLSRLKRPL